MPTIATLHLVTLAALVLVAAFTDIRSRTIPNWLTGAGFLLGLILQIAQRGWIPGLREALLGAGLGFAVYLGLFALRAMGGGDVKLMGAVGAFTGPQDWLLVFVLASVIGGVLALISLLTRGGLVRAARNVASLIWELLHLRAPHKANPELNIDNPAARTLPHGVAIALGVVVYLWK